MIRRAGLLVVWTGALIAGCGSDGSSGTPPEPQVLVEYSALDPDLLPGDVIALRTAADASSIEWAERRSGTIRRLPLDSDRPAIATDVETVARVSVGTDGEQRGLLGHTVVDGVRYAAWTDPDTNHLLVGEIDPAGAGRIVWDAGGTAGGAVGGHLQATTDGQLILGIGQLTDWAKNHGSGAMLQLDPLGVTDQEPTVVSDGYINPFAFAIDGEAVWVADNAVGDDVERIGRADLGDRDDHERSDVGPRAPSAVVTLADGQLGVCGFLDAELRFWTPNAGAYGDALGPCLTGATTLPDGAIVTATTDAIVLLPA